MANGDEKDRQLPSAGWSSIPTVSEEAARQRAEADEEAWQPGQGASSSRAPLEDSDVSAFLGSGEGGMDDLNAEVSAAQFDLQLDSSADASLDAGGSDANERGQWGGHDSGRFPGSQGVDASDLPPPLSAVSPADTQSTALDDESGLAAPPRRASQSIEFEIASPDEWSERMESETPAVFDVLPAVGETHPRPGTMPIGVAEVPEARERTARMIPADDPYSAAGAVADVPAAPGAGDDHDTEAREDRGGEGADELAATTESGATGSEGASRDDSTGAHRAGASASPGERRAASGSDDGLGGPAASGSGSRDFASGTSEREASGSGGFGDAEFDAGGFSGDGYDSDEYEGGDRFWAPGGAESGGGSEASAGARSGSSSVSRSVSRSDSGSRSHSGESTPVRLDDSMGFARGENTRSIRTPFGVDAVPVAITQIELEGGPPSEEFSWVNQFDLFREEALRLARSKRWRRLAATTAYALVHAPYSQGGTRTALLLDLARIYRDRLKEVALAEEAFAAAVADEPENAEAIAFLDERYESRGDYRGVFDLYFRAVASTWDPDDRLEWTRRAASVAADRLSDADLATRAWEQLWSLGDGDDEVARELARHYRLAGRWGELASFLESKLADASGAVRTLLLRELSEVRLSGEGDAAAAAEVLQRITGDRPDDPLVIHQLSRIYANSGDWEALRRLGLDAPSSLPAAELRARRVHVAETLWEAGQTAAAASLYAELLRVDPDDSLARERYHAHLRSSGAHEELVASLLARAEAARDDDERAELYSEAAAVAAEQLGDSRQAVALLERRRSLVGDDTGTLGSLAALYEELQDEGGLVRALEGLHDLEVEPSRRLEVLRRLAAASDSGAVDEARAEQCWKEILSIDPNDMDARERLMGLHRSRGDFEALNSALMRQIVLTGDSESALRLSRMAALNLDANFDDVDRSIDAWRRVLDYAPNDAEALEALAAKFAEKGDHQGQIAVQEQRLLTLDDADARVALALTIADAWASVGASSAAAAAYERVLHWRRGSERALEGLVRVYTDAGRADLAIAALDQAIGGCEDVSARVALLRRSIALLDEGAHGARFSRLRRIHLLDRRDGAVLDELETSAAAADAWAAFAAILVGVIATEPSEEARAAARARLAGVLDAKLGDAVRAWATSQASLRVPETVESVVGALGELAVRTGRVEDLLAILDTRTGAEVDAPERRRAIAERVRLLANEVQDPRRAFEEQRRLVDEDAADSEALAALRAMAESGGLWAEYLDVLDALGDRAADDAQRIGLAAEAFAVRGERLGDAVGAFAELVRRFRLDRHDPEVAGALVEAAGDEEWSWLLPVLEAARLADLSPSTSDEVAAVAALYADKAGDARRAFDLHVLAFSVAPESSTLPNALAGLVEAVDGYDEYAHSLRRAAAMCGDDARAVELLRRTAAVYEAHLGRPEDAVDIHRRLLELKDDELPSLEVMIASHREREQWHDLRDRLTRWVEVAEDDPRRVARLMEIGAISETHLNDVQRALDAYGRVLADNPEDEDARARTEALVHHLDDPRPRLAFLRSEMQRATGAQLVELELQVAQLQLEHLEDAEGSVATLEALVAREGVDSAGFSPLVDLLGTLGRWAERVELRLQRARSARKSEKAALLRAALEESNRCEELPLATVEDALVSLLEIEPDDLVVHRRYAQLLRDQERFEELSGLLARTARAVDDPAELAEVRHELARLLWHNLDRRDDAVALWRELAATDPTDASTQLALARASLASGDLDDYIERRRELARALPAREAALTMCHLAEACDESPEHQARVAEFYREARRLDADCEPAKEALKGIGRRKKELRPEAALLPEAGERELGWPARAARLEVLGDELVSSDVNAAVEWYLRAVVTDPDDVSAWDALASAYDRTEDFDGAFRARVRALDAVRRARPLSVHELEDEAGRLLDIAEAAQRAGSHDEHERIVRRVLSLAPGHAPTSVAVAELMLERGDHEEAFQLIDGLVARHAERIPAAVAADVWFVRGEAQRAAGRNAEARSDYRAALRHRPLFAPALRAYAELLAEDGRFGSAIEHLVRALVTEDDPDRRADLFFELGVLWEDGMGEPDEAGACYEFARAEGLASRELMRRIFKHFQRTGQLGEGLAVVDGLLESAEDASETARLWLARGEIFAAHEGREDEAVEAFDMALSYDPDLNQARAALAGVLERRGDWDQLLEILEAIADSDAGEDAERADAFLRMGRIARSRLGDVTRARAYLADSVAACPTQAAVAILAEIAADSLVGSDEHLALLGRLAELGPPTYEHVLRFGELVVDRDPRLGWCLLSPALMIRSSDDGLKARLRDMRRDYERPPILVPTQEDRARCAAPEFEELRRVLGELEAVIEVGVSDIAAVRAEGVTDVSVHSNIGRTFATIASACGIPDASLHRATSMAEPVAIVNRGAAPAVVIRGDVFQQLARAEIGFMLAYATELASAGTRGIAATRASDRGILVRGLWSALGFCDAKGDAKVLAERIRAAVDEDGLDAWAARLEPLSSLEPVEVAEGYWRSARDRALRVGLVGGADFFQAVRLVIRMHDEADRPGVFDDCDAFDAYLESAPGLVELAKFAASPFFAEMLADSMEL